MSRDHLAECRAFAKAEGWTEIDHQTNISMVSFVKGTSRLNYYYSRGTVGTVLDHPQFGRNSMFRKRVFGRHLRVIFRNPRVHDGLGYHMHGQHIYKLKKGANV